MPSLATIPRNAKGLRFRTKNTALVTKATAILEEERPMTLRQLYYRILSAGLLKNSDEEYKRLGGVMTRLREAGDIPRTWIVDSSIQRREGFHLETPRRQNAGF